MTENSRDELEESFDNETGEKKTKTIYCNIQRVNTDAETGEPELFDVIVKRKTFQVPVKYLEQPLENRGFKQKTRRKIVSEFHFQKKKNQKGIVKAVFLSDKPNVGPFVFMLPTLLIFPAWASILCLLWEAFMHIWSHKRNRKRKNLFVEYRSPLHLLSSQFCIRCRSRKWTEKITEIQNKRKLKRKMSSQKSMR